MSSGRRFDTAAAQAGVALGWTIAPWFALVSWLRRSRTFHPRGTVFHAWVARHAEVSPALSELADRLTGRALVRFSGALWKRAESLPDVLGCALRLRRDDSDDPVPESGDQDLLFATIRRPWTMPFAPFTTDVRDYLTNDYFAVSPFDAGLANPVYLKLHPSGTVRERSGRREERLTRAVGRHDAVLELCASERPFGPWAPVVTLVLQRTALIDGEALRFRPYRSGRGLEPRGFVHSLRVGVYASSQRARPVRKRP